MPIAIEMPKLSDTMTEGTLVRWIKKVGDTVAVGDVLAEVETDKATMEMEAFDDGVLTEIYVKDGEEGRSRPKARSPGGQRREIDARPHRNPFRRTNRRAEKQARPKPAPVHLKKQRETKAPAATLESATFDRPGCHDSQEHS